MMPIHIGLMADPAKPTAIARTMDDLTPPGGEDRDGWEIEVLSEPFMRDVRTSTQHSRD